MLYLRKDTSIMIYRQSMRPLSFKLITILIQLQITMFHTLNGYCLE